MYKKKYALIPLPLSENGAQQKGLRTFLIGFKLVRIFAWANERDIFVGSGGRYMPRNGSKTRL